MAARSPAALHLAEEGATGLAQEAAWQALASEFGGRFVDGGFQLGPWRLFGSQHVMTSHKAWTVKVEAFLWTTSMGRQDPTVRLRTRYESPDGFSFELRPSGRSMGFLDATNFKIDDPVLDRDFIIQASSRSKIKDLLTNEAIKIPLGEFGTSLIRSRDLGPRDKTGHLPDYPRVNELFLESDGAKEDLARMKRLFSLFCQMLDGLVGIGSASEAAT